MVNAVRMSEAQRDARGRLLSAGELPCLLTGVA